MSVKPEQFITTAEKFFRVASNEADYRCCITRAYYGSYNAAIEYHGTLDRPGMSKANCGEHENLIHKLQHPNIGNTDKNYLISKELGRFLFKMRYQRVRSDYRLNETVTESDAKTTIAEAKIFINTISEV